MLSSVPSREPLAKKDTSQAGRAGQTRPGRLTGQESNKWSAVSVSVCLYLFLFSPAVESARNELGETLEGPGATCPGRNLASKVPTDTDSQHQSTTTTTAERVQAAGFNGHAPLWSVGRLWHGSSTDCLPCLNCDGSKQAKTDCGRVDGASAE